MILWLILSLSMLWFVIFRLKRRRMYQLAELIPSTKDHQPLIGVAYSMLGDNENFMKQLQKYCIESISNDGIVKMWLGHILYFVHTDALDVEYILKNCLEKDDLHRFIRAGIGNAGIYAPVAIWRRRRKILIPTFYPKVLENFVGKFSEHSEMLAKNLQQYVGNGRHKLWPALCSCTLDSICESAMGVKMYAQENLDAPFVSALGSILKIIPIRVFNLLLHPDCLFNLHPISRKFYSCVQVVYNFTDEVILKKQEEIQEEEKSKTDQFVEPNSNTEKKSSFLELLITQSKSGQGLTNIELREEVITLAVAGSDTAAVTIGNTLKLLGKYPHIQDKVYEELQDVFGNSDRPLVKEDLPQLKYLERVIKESLRLFPPVPFIIRKIVDEITLPSGRVLPAGSGSMISILGVHRNPKFWGPDADHFDPDRFLPERFKTLPCSFIPFSFGPRNCVGYQYAMMAVKTILSTVLRRYKMVDHPEDGPVPKIDSKLEIMMKAVDDYEISLEKRKKHFEA